MREVLAAFRARLNEVFARNESEETLLEEILAVILLLFAMGSGYESEDDLTPQDREWLDTMYQMSVASAPGIMERNMGDISMGPTVDRLVHHVMGAYHYSLMIHGIEEETLYRWQLGETEVSCGDCAGYARMGPQPGHFWVRVAEERNHYPQSPHLECKGLHCDCTILEVLNAR